MERAFSCGNNVMNATPWLTVLPHPLRGPLGSASLAS
jgi:hypothetical protein